MHEVQTAVRPHRAFKTAGVQSCLFGSVNHGVVRGSQKEAYGRLLHTLCAAALIGATSLTFSSMGAFWYDLGKVLALLLLAVLFFFFGAILSKGD